MKQFHGRNKKSSYFEGWYLKHQSGEDTVCFIPAFHVNVQDHRVLVENVNMITKHAKPSAANQQGGIVNKEAYIDISNVMLLHKGKATRVGFKMDGDKKVRFAKATGEVID